MYDDQNGYIKNRYLGFNIRQIEDIKDYAKTFYIDGYIVIFYIYIYTVQSKFGHKDKPKDTSPFFPKNDPKS